MKRAVRRIVCVAAGIALSTSGLAGAGAALGAVPVASSWGRAIEVPGLGALSKGGGAEVVSVSCGSAGNCAAGGFYRNLPRRRHGQGFVVSERNGVWGRAIEVPGLGALNKGGYAHVVSMSCGSAGNCAAGGFYRNNGEQGFVVSEQNGVWGQAIKVPGLETLGETAGVTSVSCASAGNCAAGGFYQDSSRIVQGFVASEKNGVWGQAIGIPGLAALNAAGFAWVTSVSCSLRRYCAAGGWYEDGSRHVQGFVASEQNGVWGGAIGVPGLGALNKGGDARTWSVSCASAGNCAAGGTYKDRSGDSQGFVASEQNGVWGRGIEVPGLGALNKGGFAHVLSVSCGSAGNCAAGGYYWDRRDHRHGFVVSARHGAWGRAVGVPGLGALNKGGDARVFQVSCASAGNCAAGGAYADRSRHSQGFVVSEKNGVWGRAVEVTGLGALNKGGNAHVFSVSCALPGNCAAGGAYEDRSRHLHGFVT